MAMPSLWIEFENFKPKFIFAANFPNTTFLSTGPSFVCPLSRKTIIDTTIDCNFDQFVGNISSSFSLKMQVMCC